MDLKAEKAALISQMEQIEDQDLILAIKHLLEYGLSKQGTDPAFIASLERALAQSEKGEGRPNDDVKRDFLKRYSS